MLRFALTIGLTTIGTCMPWSLVAQDMKNKEKDLKEEEVENIPPKETAQELLQEFLEYLNTPIDSEANPKSISKKIPDMALLEKIFKRDFLNLNQDTEFSENVRWALNQAEYYEKLRSNYLNNKETCKYIAKSVTKQSTSQDIFYAAIPLITHCSKHYEYNATLPIIENMLDEMGPNERHNLAQFMDIWAANKIGEGLIYRSSSWRSIVVKGTYDPNPMIRHMYKDLLIQYFDYFRNSDGVPDMEDPVSFEDHVYASIFRIKTVQSSTNQSVTLSPISSINIKDIEWICLSLQSESPELIKASLSISLKQVLKEKSTSTEFHPVIALFINTLGALANSDSFSFKDMMSLTENTVDGLERIRDYRMTDENLEAFAQIWTHILLNYEELRFSQMDVLKTSLKIVSERTSKPVRFSEDQIILLSNWLLMFPNYSI